MILDSDQSILSATVSCVRPASWRACLSSARRRRRCTRGLELSVTTILCPAQKPSRPLQMRGPNSQPSCITGSLHIAPCTESRASLLMCLSLIKRVPAACLRQADLWQSAKGKMKPCFQPLACRPVLGAGNVDIFGLKFNNYQTKIRICCISVGVPPKGLICMLRRDSSRSVSIRCHLHERRAAWLQGTTSPLPLAGPFRLLRAVPDCPDWTLF